MFRDNLTLALLTPLLLLVSVGHTLAATCKTFTVTEDLFFITGPDDPLCPPSSIFTVSPGLTCQPSMATNLTATHQPGCPLPASGIVTAARTLNLTGLDASTASSLWSLIAAASGQTFLAAATANLSGEATFFLGLGQSGFARATAHSACVVGALAGCDPAVGVEDGARVLACAPRTEPGCSHKGKKTFPCVSATYSFVNTTAAEAAAVVCGPCEEEEKESGGVGRGGARWGVLGLAAVGAVVFGGGVGL
ncbi:hypothetical protein MBLNU459_g1130t1 [Dothideomycetes sp. NU459]